MATKMLYRKGGGCEEITDSEAELSLGRV